MRIFIKGAFLAMLFFSCGGGISDQVIDLGEGYQLVSEGGDYKFIAGPNMVYPTVDSICFTNEYIFIHQTPSYEYARGDVANDLRNSFIVKYREKGVIPLDSGEYWQKKADSALRLDSGQKYLFNKENYYIIEKTAKAIPTPLTRKEFYGKLRKLKIDIRQLDDWINPVISNIL